VSTLSALLHSQIPDSVQKQNGLNLQRISFARRTMESVRDNDRHPDLRGREPDLITAKMTHTPPGMTYPPLSLEVTSDAKKVCR
jgi:hypothetical protein